MRKREQKVSGDIGVSSDKCISFSILESGCSGADSLGAPQIGYSGAAGSGKLWLKVVSKRGLRFCETIL